MFTGIVVERGRIVGEPAPSAKGGVGLVVGHSPQLAARLEIGASLAVSGVCLTVTAQGEAGELATSHLELSAETLERSNLGALSAGSEVNLEPALRAGDALGGHWVQGHVDATFALLGRDDRGEHSVFTFELPAATARYVVEKGSLCLDGVSLTVARRESDRFSVALIPHTLEVTTFGGRQPGERLNFEIDVLAKYVENLLAARGLVDAG